MKREKSSLISSLILNKILIYKLAIFATLLGIGVIAPFFKQQIITGTIVNASFFVGVMLVGVQATILLGLLPSLFALWTGLLPGILAPMIPFIMTGNTILIITFAYLRKRNYWLAAIISSFFKFVFLFLISQIVINLIIKKEIATKVAVMMSWPQLLTALAGAFIAYFFLASLKQNWQN